MFTRANNTFVFLKHRVSLTQTERNKSKRLRRLKHITDLHLRFWKFSGSHQMNNKHKKIKFSQSIYIYINLIASFFKYHFDEKKIWFFYAFSF